MARIIAEFSQDVEDELRKTKGKMDEHTRNTDSYFERLVNQADHLRANLRGTFETLSGDAKVRDLNLREICLLIEIPGSHFLGNGRCRWHGGCPTSAQQSPGHLPSDKCRDGGRA